MLPENKGKPEYPKYTIHNDPTTPSLDKIKGLVDYKAYPEHTRWVHRAGGPICTFAYALSQAGARKVLYALSVDREGGGAFDNILADFCRDGTSGNPDGMRAQCLAVTPPLFYHHRAKGSASGDSDILDHSVDQDRVKGQTENIVWSARNNIRNMLLGLEMEDQFKD